MCCIPMAPNLYCIYNKVKLNLSFDLAVVAEREYFEQICFLIFILLKLVYLYSSKVSEASSLLELRDHLHLGPRRVHWQGC